MNFLDLRTILFGYVITDAICTAVMISLYFQSRRRTPEIAYWTAAFLMHFTGLLCINLRGVVPDFFSIVLGNTLMIACSLVIFIGLEAYFKQPSRQIGNFALLGLFTGLHTYFTYTQPNLLARNLNFSITLLLFTSQIAWFLLRRLPAHLRPTARLIGILFLFNSLFSLARVISDLLFNPGSDLFRSGLPDALIILTYQVLLFALTFAIFLLVNRRLVSDLENDIAERSEVEAALRKSEELFSTAFQNMPDALCISLASNGKILDANESYFRLSGYTRAEAVGRTTVELQLWDASDRNRFATLLKHSGRVANIELKFHPKIGGEIECLVSGETIQLKQGECFLIIIRDITEQKKIERAEMEQRLLAEALRDTANALNSTLKVDEVLERILNNVGRVTPHDTANIMVFEQDDTALIVRSRGYVERGSTDLLGQRISIARMPILKKVGYLGRPLAIPDTDLEPDWHSEPEVAWVKSYAVAPIRIRQYTIGFLNLESATPGFFRPEHAERLQAFADQASIAIENAHLYEDVQALAITDVLTGLFNRRGLMQLGEREVMRSQRFRHPLAAIMLDIDHFKQVNDTYGHPTGDQVLASLAACLRKLVRNVDIAARYGGEEFILLLPETELANAVQVAERIRQAVENMKVPVEGSQISGETAGVTVSLGLAMLETETFNLAELVETADQAMYAAKRAGRNRLMVSSSQPATEETLP